MNNANFYGLIEQRMPQDRSAACLRVPGAGDVSWRELHLGAGRMAALLAGLQLAPGSRLVAQVDKSPEALMLYLATLRSGLVYVPLNVAYQEAELRHFLDDSQPSVAVCAPGRLSLFDMLAPGAACFSLDEHGQGTLLQSTVMMGVPTFYTRLLQEPAFGAHACASIRLFTSGSAPLLAETFEKFRQRTGHTLLERYGMSETLMLASNPYFGDPSHDRIAGSVGPPLPGVQVRVARADGTPAAAGEVGQV